MRVRNPSAPGASAPQQQQKPATPSGLAGRLQQVQGQMKPGVARGARPNPGGVTGAAGANLPRMGKPPGAGGMQAQTEVLQGPGSAGAPQLPRNLRDAVANGMDPQVAMQRAIQNRAGFREQMAGMGTPPPRQPGVQMRPQGATGDPGVAGGGGGMAGFQPGGQGLGPTTEAGAFGQSGPSGMQVSMPRMSAPDAAQAQQNFPGYGAPTQVQSFPMPQGGPQAGGYGNDMQAKPMPGGFGQGGQQLPPGANPALAQHVQQIQGQGGQVPDGLQGAMSQIGGDPRMAPPGGAQGDPQAMAAQMGARMNPAMFQQFLAQQRGQGGPQAGMMGGGVGLDAFYR